MFFCYFVNYTQNVIAKVRQSLNDSESEFAFQLEEESLAKLQDTSDSQEMLDLLTRALDMQLLASLWVKEDCPHSLLQGMKYTSCQKMSHDVAYSMLTLTLAIKEALELKVDQDNIAEFYQNVLGVHGSHRGDLQEGIRPFVIKVLEMVEYHK
ncbi:unnamed protein product [Nippostrongylus brasiliensis]|uniref:FRY n=1 Tax=Nippostrongylus brasiliensis TaxID=27835 RepID=A0A0N4Y004_NIPBR|nr:unnamed protein product [Nippostrongylus brasiliensis]